MFKWTKKLLAVTLSAIMVLGTATTALASSGDIADGFGDNKIQSEVITVEYENIDAIAPQAKQIIDDGKILYISNPKISNEDLAVKFSIPKDDLTHYNNMLLVATSIYKIYDIYVFENHYALYVDSVETMNTPSSLMNPDSNVEMSVENEKSFASTVIVDLPDNLNVNSMINIAIESRETVRKNASKNQTVQKDGEISPSSVSLPGNPDRVYVGSCDVYDHSNNYLGYIRAIQNNYEKGYWTVNNVSQYVTDIVTQFEIYPLTTYVVRYKGRIHCNITGHTALEAASVPSNVNQSQSVTLGLNSSGMSGSTTTSWSYNPESQIINRSSSTQRVYDWTASPVNQINGKSYDLVPGLRVATTNNAGGRGGFSSMRCDSYSFFGYSTNVNEFEIGGWF